MQALQRCLKCQCLPNHIFGKDIDELFAFQTVKIEIIKDRSLGIMSKIATILIFIAVVIVQILYQGKHFTREEPHGIQRVTLQQPVQACNPSKLECLMNYTSVSKLAYCEQFTGASELQKRPCEYFDSGEVMIEAQGGMLLTSFTKNYKQKDACEGFAAQGKPCPRKWMFEDARGGIQRGTGHATPNFQAFVADLDDFTLLIDHSVRSESGAIAYDDGQMQGHYEKCDSEEVDGKLVSTNCERKKILCIHSHCDDWGMYTGKEGQEEAGFLQESGLANLPQVRDGHGLPRGAAFVRGERTDPDGGAEADEETAEPASLFQAESSVRSGAYENLHPVVSTKLGDVLSVKTLLALAGLALDDPPSGMAGNRTKAKGKTIRSEGTAIVVEIRYWNHKPWSFLTPSGPPEYVIKVSSRPVYKFKHELLKDLNAEERLMIDHYGIFFIFDITGELCVFTITGLILILTTALGLLAAANLITEMIAFNIMSDAHEYKDLKYCSSKDFHQQEKTPRG